MEAPKQEFGCILLFHLWIYGFKATCYEYIICKLNPKKWFWIPKFFGFAVYKGAPVRPKASTIFESSGLILLEV